jgi:monoterpene epsilon-lactone hydrolase
VPSPEMQTVIDSLWQRKAARASDPPRTVAQIRETLAPAGQRRDLPADIVVERLDAGGVPAYWLNSPETDPSRILLFLHGGGYTAGSLGSHGPLAAQVGRAMGRRVLFPEYSLAPEHRFPAAVDDTFAVWRWLVTTGGVNPATVVIAGDSAGGGLTLALLHRLRDNGDEVPAGGVLMSPLLDLTASGSSISERADQDPIFTPDLIRGIGPIYLGDADPHDPAASPLFAAQGGLPPLLIQVGGAEVLLSDSERLAAAVAAAGGDVILNVADGLPHVYHGAIDTPESAEATRQIVEFAPRTHTVPIG